MSALRLQLGEDASLRLRLGVLELSLAHRDPFAQVSDGRVLEQSRKDHYETGAKENVY